MNISVYLFGSFKNGYSQYPNDYAKTIFEKFYQNAKSTTQVAIYRDGDLMYYGYIRKLEAGNYLGLCTVINGKYLNSIESLFSVYEGIIELMVKNGYLIHFGNNGEITTGTHRLYENAEEITLINSSLQNSFNRLEVNALPLPPLNYSISKGTIKSFSIQDDLDQIIKSSYSNSFTFVYKSKGFNGATINSYIEIIRKKNVQVSNLQNDLERCKSALNKAQLAQKRFKTVAWLSVILVIISIILINVASTSSQRAQTISSQVETIGGLETKVGNLYIDSARTHTTLKETANKLGNAQELIEYKNDTLAGLRERNMSLKESLDYTTRQLQEQKKIVKEQSDLIQQRTLEIRSLKKRLENESFNPKGIDIQIYEGNRVKYLYSTSPWDIDGIDKRWKIYQLKVYYNGNLQKSQQIRIKR